jgi:hypothetical protein
MTPVVIAENGFDSSVQVRRFSVAVEIAAAKISVQSSQTLELPGHLPPLIGSFHGPRGKNVTDE